jgi:MoaA/NifB/PqqE/SkfB family radical SAM enzyme
MGDPLFELVMENGRAFLERSSDRRRVAAVTKLEAAALKMIAEGTSVPDVQQVWRSVAPSLADHLLERVDSRFAALLSAKRGIRVPQSYEVLGDIRPPAPNSSLRELPGPRVLHWWVTRYCPRKCVYCYAEPQHGSRSEDALIERSDLQRIFQEAAMLGAEHMLVAGAEPFLRPDLPEVMGDAISVGLTPFVTTKHPISEKLAERLAAADVKHISLSLDSDTPDEAFALIGSRSYPEQVRRSIKHLTRAGVQFSIQAVATSFNSAGIKGVAQIASESGARVMQIVPFESVRKPIGRYQNSDMLAPEPAELRELVAQLERRFESVKFELFEKLGSGSRSQFHCDIGMTKLFFLPDGVVHRCYKLIDDLGLCGKDLRTTTVAEAWHDPGFTPVISPSQSLYSESACGTCGRFGKCHAEGRCIFESSIVNGTYFDQDRACDGPHPVRDLVHIAGTAPESRSPQMV